MTTEASSLSLQDALSLYQREFLAGRNLAPLTRQAYLRDLDELADFLADRPGIREASRVTREHLEAFLSELDRRGLSGNYRRRKIAAVRSLFGFLEEQGFVLKSPAGKLIPPEREHNQPRYLTEREYKALLDACRNEIRDSAIIELLLQTGMRLCEVSRLKVSDVGAACPHLQGARWWRLRADLGQGPARADGDP